MAVNKVVYNTENGPQTLIDLTGDTVNPETLAEGVVAHDSSGNKIIGNMSTTNVLYTEQILTETQKAQVRTNIGALSNKELELALDNLETKLNKQNLVIVNSEEEMTDSNLLYVLNGYIWQYGTTTKEVVIPGETITTPSKAIIIKGYRYSHSGGSFSAQSNTASIIFPIKITKTTSSTSTVDFVLTNMKRSTSYTAMYHGNTNTKFEGSTAQSYTTDSTATRYTVYGLPTGEWFVIFFVQYDGSQSYSNASFIYDDTTFTVGDNMEVYDNPSYASLAAFGSTTTTPSTTEIITTEGFYNTNTPFASNDYGYRIDEIESKIEAISKVKSKNIVINNDIQTLSSSVSLSIPQLKKNKTIAFSGIYSGTLSEISIIQGEGTGYTECKCVVSTTSITIIKNGSSVYTAEHGLAFGSYFSIVLVTKNLNKTKAYLSSGGDTFTTAEFVWNSSRSGLKLYTNTPFIRYQFSFGSNDFSKKVWLYGDSYFDHWLPLSISRGYTNCLTDGYSGGGSSSGLTSFRLAMEHGKPEKVVWCLGMNNGDSSSINQTWLDSITAVKEICEANGIELWVTTIPSTPSVNNTYKNAYIRANFNCIDIAKYVGSEESTAWYTGLLSSDNVHPSTEGDFYIANIFEMSFPEMLDS